MLCLMRGACVRHLQEQLGRFSWPTELIDVALDAQVDLLLEAKTLWRFGKNFSRDKDVTLPVPLYPWCSQDVLMQTFEEGMHISTFMELDQDVDRRAAVADVGSNCMLDMMLVHNLIHSDLHPGNILVRWCLPDGWFIRMAATIPQFLPVDKDKVCCSPASSLYCLPLNALIRSTTMWLVWRS